MIILREDWGARAPTRTPKVKTSQRVGLLPHWNGPRLRLDPDGVCRCENVMRGIQNYHMSATPTKSAWSDFAYSFGVCPHGKVFEGRGLYWDEFATDAKENGHKWYTVFLMIGADHVNHATEDYVISYGGYQFFMQNVERITPAMREALNWLRKYLVEQSFCDLRVAAHCDFKNKSCPGPDAVTWARANDNVDPRGVIPEDGTIGDNMLYIIRSDQGPAFWADNGSPVGNDYGFWKDNESVKVVTVSHDIWQRRLAGYQTHKYVAGDIANAVLSGLDLRDVDEQKVADAVVSGIRKVWSSV